MHASLQAAAEHGPLRQSTAHNSSCTKGQNAIWPLFRSKAFRSKAGTHWPLMEVSMAVPSSSLSPCAVWASPMDSRAPATLTG